MKTIYNMPTSELIFSYVYPEQKVVRSRCNLEDVVYKRLSKKYKLGSENIDFFINREEEIIKARGNNLNDYYFAYNNRIDRYLEDFLSKLKEYPGKLEGLSAYTYSELVYFYSMIKTIVKRYHKNKIDINDYLFEFLSSIDKIDTGISRGYDLADLKERMNECLIKLVNEANIYKKYANFWKDLKRDLNIFISYLTDYHLYDDGFNQHDITLSMEENYLKANGLNNMRKDIYSTSGDEYGLLEHDKKLLNKYGFAYFNAE